MALVPQIPPASGSRNAARDAAQQEAFLREVDEAVRQDEMLSLLRRYGRPVGLAVVAGLLGLGGYLWWDHSQQQVAAERAERLTIAMDRVEAGSLAAATADIDTLASEGRGGSRAAAAILRAGVMQHQDKPAEAAKAFAAIAADSGVPQPFRDLATIREVAAQFDTLPADRIVARLKPLAVPGNPWFASAGEMVGIAYMKQGRNDLAGPLFAAIAKDKTAPESTRSRVRQLAGLLGYDAIDDVARAAAGEGEAVAGATQP